MFFLQARSGDLGFTVGRGTGLMLEFGYGARVLGDAAVSGGAIYAASVSMSEDNALANAAVLWFDYHESTPNADGAMDVYSDTGSVMLSNTTDADISSGLRFDFVAQGTRAVTAVPEPDAMLLGGIAGLGALTARRRQRRQVG
ncbi:PEP-CTERM sorting domain-containing protein [Derxia gummosa]|uniref:PEP-CTERM sorting domain-containing protein n=1 Tax=Derxia gummosa DSM 723 TaxID=1121388 RepID=A0A8B6X4K0_9BURK|nr:PEP-CTERM sorting domain-containing protein [Derxia gummosa]